MNLFDKLFEEMEERRFDLSLDLGLYKKLIYINENKTNQRMAFNDLLNELEKSPYKFDDKDSNKKSFIEEKFKKELANIEEYLNN